MSPEALQLFFRLGVWIVGLSACLIFIVPRDGPEIVPTICALGTGLLLLGGVTLVSRKTRR
jgi:hypothetical protein